MPPPVDRKQKKTLHALHRSEHWLPLLAWCVWLIGNWLIARPDRATLPAVRWVLIAATLGLILFWPAWRLSLGQDPRLAPSAADSPNAWQRRELGEILTGTLALLIIFQCVLWSLQICLAWSTLQTLWLNGVLAAWALLGSAIAAWGVLARRRMLAMAALVGLCIFEPVLRAIFPGFWPGTLGRSAFAGPLQAVASMGQKPSSWTLAGWPEHVGVVTSLAVLAWGMLLWQTRRRT